ncbi:hypothetical protein R50073_51270 (plasmid) [Maricurvus nonylphenolicus]|uniref:hypothetical protein n=1 Tax=Maricurvus nonylphenolicus TaxID=1008307 RepID=UPI0036F305B3
MNIYSRWAFVLFSSTLIAACSSPQFKQGEVQSKWTQSLRQLGIVPTFPPREDLFVGDVYVSNYDPESEVVSEIFSKDFDKLKPDEKPIRLSIGMNSRLHRINLLDEISAEYSNSLSAPPTTNEYNSILENPTLAAIDTKIAAQKAVVDALKKSVSDAAEKEAKAEQELKTKKREKADADKKVNDATAALTKAKGKKPDVSAEKSQLAQMKLEKRSIDDEVLAAKRAVEDAPDDPKDPAKITADRNKLLADRKLEDHNKKIARLTADITAKEAVPADVSIEEKALQDAVGEQSALATAVTTATRAKEDATAEKTKIAAENAPKITKEEEKLKTLTDLKANVQIAGAKNLYSQPQYTAKDIFKDEVTNDVNNKPVTKSRINRLRLVGFPEFASTSISQGDLSALIPSEGLAANITASKVGSIVVKVPAAESYGISFSEFFDNVFDQEAVDTDIKSGQNASTTMKVRHYKFKDDNLKDKLTKTAFMQVGSEEGNNSRHLYFRFITEVFYARAIDVSVIGSERFGGLLEYAKPFNVGSSDDNTDTSQSEDPTKDDFTGAINSTAGGESDSFLSTIKSNLGRTQTVPGGAIQFLSASERSLGMRRVYDRPIAIGFRAVTVKYDLCANFDEINVSNEDGKFIYYNDCEDSIDGVVVSSSAVPLSPM